MRTVRKALRLAALAGVSLPMAAALGITGLAVPPNRLGKYRAMFLGAWSRIACRLLNIRVDMVGTVPEEGSWLAVSNHLGYADIPVLGSVLTGSFVAKSEVARWPVIGGLARLAGTVFVDRDDRVSAGPFVEEVRRRTSGGEGIFLFPEGTSSRGDGILPFKSTPFEAVAGDPSKSVLPVYLDLVEIDGLPAVGAGRDAVCWHGDAEFVPHFLELLALRSVRFRVVVGTPIACGESDRKTLAATARDRVGSLRQVSSRLGSQPDWGFLWFHPIP